MPLGDNVLFRDWAVTSVDSVATTISIPKPPTAIDGDGLNLSIIWWSTSDGGAPFGADIETTLLTDLGDAGVNYFHFAAAFEVNPGIHWLHHEQVIFTAQTADTTYDFALPDEVNGHVFGVVTAVIPDDAGSISSGYGQLGAGGLWTDNADLGVFFGSHGWGALTQGFVEVHIYVAETYTGSNMNIVEGDGNFTVAENYSTPDTAGELCISYWDRPKGTAGNAFLFADFTATANISGYYMALAGSHQGDYPPALRPEPPGEVSLVPRSRTVRIQELPYNVGGMTPRRR